MHLFFGLFMHIFHAYFCSCIVQAYYWRLTNSCIPCLSLFNLSLYSWFPHNVSFKFNLDNCQTTVSWILLEIDPCRFTKGIDSNSQIWVYPRQISWNLSLSCFHNCLVNDLVYRNNGMPMGWLLFLEPWD